MKKILQITLVAYFYMNLFSSVARAQMQEAPPPVFPPSTHAKGSETDATQSDSLIKDFSGSSEKMVEPQTITGEVFSPRRGELSFELPIVSLPGSNGLAIDVRVSFNRVPQNYPMFQYWAVEVPRLIIQDRNNTCGDTQTGPILFLPATPPKQFLKSNGASPLTAADYVTLDLWTAKCSGKYNYIVRSPSGLIYRFTLLPAERIGAAFGGDGTGSGYLTVYPNRLFSEPAPSQPLQSSAVFIPSQVEDAYGNWIKYNFYPGFEGLKSITSNDGRSVSFTWQQFDFGYIALPKTTSAIKTISANGKTWTFDYKNQFDVDDVGDSRSSKSGRNPLVDTITRPDGYQWKFKYRYYRNSFRSMTYIDPTEHPSGNWGPLYMSSTRFPWSAPGVNFHISQITAPNGLVADYSYTPRTPFFVDGIDGVPGGSQYFSLKQKTYSGAGLRNPISWSYEYVVKNFVPQYKLVDISNNGDGLNVNWQFITGPNGVFDPSKLGDPYSFTFEMGPSKMKVLKFRRPNTKVTTRFPIAGIPMAPFDYNLVVEAGTFPLPAAGTIPPAAEPPPPSLPPPSVVLNDVQQTYPYGMPITIQFSTTGVPIWAKCSVDDEPPVACNTFNSFTTPQNLSRGPHTITVTINDLFGTTSVKSFSFWVGDPADPVAPQLAVDLVSQKAIPGKPVRFVANFSGRVTRYQWSKDGLVLPNQTQNILVINAVTVNDFGKYKITAFNESTQTASSEVRLRIDPALLVPILEPLSD